MSFFDLPAAAVNREALDAFLAERLPESLNLDYKRELSDSTFETIAAMANTYGGVILIGVGEDPDDPARPLLPPTGVDAGVRERLINQAYTRLQPPFAPDVIPVALDDGKVVLVIRVDTRRADRPIVVTTGDNAKIPIRLEARNAPADRYRMADLFAESSSAAAGAAGISNLGFGVTGGYPLDDRTRPALLARIGIEAAIPPERLDVAVIDTSVRNALGEALENSPLDNWISLQVSNLVPQWDSSFWRPTQEPYSNRSFIATLRKETWLGNDLRAPFVGQASLLLPSGIRVLSGRVSLLIDLAFDPDPLVSASNLLQSRHVLSLDDLYGLFVALLQTALDVAAPATFPQILGVPVWDQLGPVVHLFSPHAPGADPPSGIGNFLFARPYFGRTEPTLDLAEATFIVPRNLDIETPQRRREVVATWLTRLFLDMGLRSFENELRALTAQ